MSLKKVSQEKSNTVFKKLDIIVYAIIIAVIIFAFVLTFVLSSKSPLNLIEVYCDDNLVMTYSFSQDSFVYAQGYENEFKLNKEGDCYIVEFIHNDSENVFQIDTNRKEIKMIDANCSTSKDCKSMHISSPNDLIVCVPNKVIIKAVGEDKIKDPIIG